MTDPQAENGLLSDEKRVEGEEIELTKAAFTERCFDYPGGFKTKKGGGLRGIRSGWGGGKRSCDLEDWGV